MWYLVNYFCFYLKSSLAAALIPNLQIAVQREPRTIDYFKVNKAVTDLKVDIKLSYPS